ncbi:hypothetical protein HDU98_011683 [Podochytrium sp. JEL0797]|nr:hypothetical protein HDU98_011683 [Podochytrium sp. JEL0797]
MAIDHSDTDSEDLQSPIATPHPDDHTTAASDIQTDKRQNFIDRFDVAVTEFLQKGKSTVALHTPAKVESNFRIFRQWSKEKLTSPSADEPSNHITTQPEVDEAGDEVKAMSVYFTEIGDLVAKHAQQLKALNETEAAMALFFQQKGYQEKMEEISSMSIDIGKTYSANVQTRAAQVHAMEQFSEFVQTFKNKAIADSVETIDKQHVARIEFDAFANKIVLLQRTVSLSGSTVLGKELPPTLDLTPVEKEFEHAKQQFLAAKNKYQNLSTAVIDKAVLLEMKRDVDYRVQLEKVWRVNHEE